MALIAWILIFKILTPIATSSSLQAKNLSIQDLTLTLKIDKYAYYMHYIGMAPTIFQIWNLRIVIYPKDHEPAHVHVIGPDAEAKFEIKTLECIENHGFSEKSLKRIKEYLKDRKTNLMEAWDDYQK